jgi:hypothetical protein
MCLCDMRGIAFSVTLPYNPLDSINHDALAVFAADFAITTGPSPILLALSAPIRSRPKQTIEK